MMIAYVEAGRNMETGWMMMMMMMVMMMMMMMMINMIMLMVMLMIILDDDVGNGHCLEDVGVNGD